MNAGEETWPETEPPQVIGRGEVHVCKIWLRAEEEQLSRLLAMLSSQEQERAARFSFPHDRHRFIVAHGVMRELLGGYLGIAAGAVELIAGEYGKPALPDRDSRPQLHFNLAHSGEIALFACALGIPVGVDIEQIRPIEDPEGLSRQVFSYEEYEDWRAVAPEKKLESFFAGWTRKEAVIKAAGEGLSMPLQRFRVSLLPGQPARLLAFDRALEPLSQLCLVQINPEPGYAAALAVGDQNFQLRCYTKNIGS